MLSVDSHTSAFKQISFGINIKDYKTSLCTHVQTKHICRVEIPYWSKKGSPNCVTQACITRNRHRHCSDTVAGWPFTIPIFAPWPDTYIMLGISNLQVCVLVRFYTQHFLILDFNPLTNVFERLDKLIHISDSLFSNTVALNICLNNDSTTWDCDLTDRLL